MGILSSLFGKKPEPKPVTAANSGAAADPRTDPNLIRMFDAYGREVFISKEEWRKNVLPGAIKERWDQPDQLYGLILGALNDGFRKDIIGAAKHLFDLDPSSPQSACIWGIVLLGEGRLQEAEKVLRSHGDRHGEDGYVLTNLAKVLAEKGDHADAEATLWRALNVDPNQENAVGWYMAIHRERGGEAASQAALRQLAALKGSWRAQLWLARTALAAKDLPKALSLYRECLKRTGQPAHGDVLMQISGDLGRAGHLAELLTLVEPEFDSATHGLLVGNNLLKAHIDLGHIDDARRILDQLYGLKRPDWQEHLSYWDTEIAKLRVAHQSTTGELTVGLLVDDGPVWLNADSPAAELFPAKSDEAPIVSFLGSSAEVKNSPERIVAQLADAPGRLSRALPLFLAEQTWLGTDARTRTLVPWLDKGGFVLFGSRVSDSDAVQYATRDAKTDYVVVSHLDCRADDWTLDVRVLRASDGKPLADITERFPMAAPTEAITRIARQVRDLICRTGTVRQQRLPPTYALPAEGDFPYYLLRLEQLLAVRCGSMSGAQPSFLSGERDIVAGVIDLCLKVPASVSSRLLLAQMLRAMKRVRPAVVAEFRDRVRALQRDKPLPSTAANAVQALIEEALIEP